MASRPRTAAKPAEQAAKDKAKSQTNGHDAEADDAPDADAIIKAARINDQNIMGDLGDFIISRMKAAKHIKDWEKMSEAEQREQIEQAMHWSKSIVAGVAKAMMSRGLPHRPVKLGKFAGAVGESIVELKTVLAFDEEIGRRLAAGVDAVLVFASADVFEGAMETQATPDEQGLGLEASDTPEHDEDGVIKDDETPAPPPAPPAGDPPPAEAPAPQ